MTDAKPLTNEELRSLNVWCQDAAPDELRKRLLATLRRRDELIRHAVNRNAHDDSCDLCQEIQAIVEAGNE